MSAPPARPLPAEFLRHLAQLEAAYLRETDPIRQSGFSGGAERWRAERSPILDAFEAGGELLDVGCANGYLLECLVRWGGERGLTLIPFGVDQGAGLIELARQRLPTYREHLFVANAWGWIPPQRFRYVYCVHDCVPPADFGALVEQLLARMVSPGGRLVLGAYGSRTRGEPAVPIHEMLAALGHVVVGSAAVGQTETARYAWIDARS
jgi:SAM-dependent methyltransferase